MLSKERKRICQLKLFMTYFLVSLIILFLSKSVKGQDRETQHIRTKISLESEYFFPLHSNREIETLSLTALYGWERISRMQFTFAFGITGTSAWGNITQLDTNFNEITFENSAFGLGPVFFLSIQPLSFKQFSITPEFLGSVIFYSEKFPAGGDIYNFMWRLGGSVNYEIPKSNYVLSLSTRWMHVSNGQGVSSKNPSYEGQGIGIRLIKYLIPDKN